jgi:hypothetical protein
MVQYDRSRGISQRVRWQQKQLAGTVAAGVSGAVLVSALLIYEDVIVTNAPVWLGWGAAIGFASFLLAISTIGFHLQLRAAYGRLGRIGMAILGITFASFGMMGFIATGLGVIGGDPETYRLGGIVVARAFGSIGMLGMPIGALVLGAALWRYEVTSKTIATLLMATFPGQFVHIATVEAFVQLTGRGWGIFLFVVPLGLGWIGLSYYVRRQAIEEAQGGRSKTAPSSDAS